MSAHVVVTADLRGNNADAGARVKGHRSTSGEVHIQLTLADVVVLLDIVQAEAIMMRLATAIALARQPRRAKREEVTE